MQRSRRGTATLFALWLVAGASPIAQVPDRATPVFTRQAIARAVSQDTAPMMPQDPRTDWSRLRQFTNQEVLVFAQGMAGRKSRLVSVDDTALAVVDLESSRGSTLVIPRADVSEIRQRSGPRRSPQVAVIGVLAGAALGIAASLNLVYKQCGGSCADEKLLMGASLVGLPIVGGLVGYRLGERQLTTIYLKP